MSYINIFDKDMCSFIVIMRQTVDIFSILCTDSTDTDTPLSLRHEFFTDTDMCGQSFKGLPTQCFSTEKEL